MSSTTGSPSEQAHTLIAQGLRLADQSNLEGALSYWRLAARYAPAMRAPHLLVEIAEAFLEASEIGIALDPPDFRSHLADIDYHAPAQPGARRKRREGDLRHTTRGRHVERDAGDAGSSSVGARPRYRATEPPPPAHQRGAARARHRPPDDLLGDTAEVPAKRYPSGPGGRAPSPSGGQAAASEVDPWAELGSEMDSEMGEAVTGEWDFYHQGPEAEAGHAVAGESEPRSVWDESQLPSVSESEGRPAQGGAARTPPEEDSAAGLFEDENLAVGDPFEGEPLLTAEGEAQARAAGRRDDLLMAPDSQGGDYDFELIEEAHQPAGRSGAPVAVFAESATPRMLLGQDQLVWQSLDAKTGFVLSQVDGLLTVQDIIDIASLPRRETIAILADLVREGIVAMT